MPKKKKTSTKAMYQSPKNNQPTNEKKIGLLELIKNLWLPVAGFLSAIVSVYTFYENWQKDPKTFTIILGGDLLLLLFILILWINKYTKSGFAWRLSQIGVMLIYIGIPVSLQYLANEWVNKENKLVVLVATFDGPEEVYGVHDEIVQALGNNFLDNPAVEIIALPTIITPDQGSSAALALGKRHHADIIIWGWYYPIQNPNITVHFEFPKPELAEYLKDNSTLRPKITLDDLSSFNFQQQLGAETTALISYLDGLIKYTAKDYEGAIVQFSKSITTLENTNSSVVQIPTEIYFYRAYCYQYVEQRDLAIADYTKAIDLKPEIAVFYYNRGMVYFDFQKYADAILDFSKAIDIDHQYAHAYIFRGSARDEIGQFDTAAEDFTKAIEINPQDPMAYHNRAATYRHQKLYDLSILDYSKVIDLTPKDSDAFYGRGSIYYILKQYESAVSDFSKAVKFNPQDADTYLYRGHSYYLLKQYSKAINDYATVIKLNAKEADAYRFRGYSYYFLEQYSKAIADLTKTIELDPQNSELYYFRGQAYKLIGKSDEASADFSMYNELTGKDAP